MRPSSKVNAALILAVIFVVIVANNIFSNPNTNKDNTNETTIYYPGIQEDYTFKHVEDDFTSIQMYAIHCYDRDGDIFTVQYTDSKQWSEEDHRQLCNKLAPHINITVPAEG